MALIRDNIIFPLDSSPVKYSESVPVLQTKTVSPDSNIPGKPPIKINAAITFLLSDGISKWFDSKFWLLLGLTKLTNLLQSSGNDCCKSFEIIWETYGLWFVCSEN